MLLKVLARTSAASARLQALNSMDARDLVLSATEPYVIVTLKPEQCIVLLGMLYSEGEEKEDAHS